MCDRVWCVGKIGDWLVASRQHTINNNNNNNNN